MMQSWDRQLLGTVRLGDFSQAWLTWQPGMDTRHLRATLFHRDGLQRYLGGSEPQNLSVGPLGREEGKGKGAPRFEGDTAPCESSERCRKLQRQLSGDVTSTVPRRQGFAHQHHAACSLRHSTVFWIFIRSPAFALSAPVLPAPEPTGILLARCEWENKYTGLLPRPALESRVQKEGKPGCRNVRCDDSACSHPPRAHPMRVQSAKQHQPSQSTPSFASFRDAPSPPFPF